jgi:membrane protein DedA with SNARE-associated domain
MQIPDIVAFAENLYLSYGLPIIFLTSLIEITPFGWAIPGGSLLTLGGFFAYGRPTYLIATIFFGWIGSWSTFIIAYLLGAGAANKLNLNIRGGKAAKQAEILLKRQGPVVMTSAMLASITRFWIAFYAGSKKFDPKKFTIYSGVASLSWTSLMVIIGYLAGTQRDKLEGSSARLGILSWFLFIIFAIFIYFKVRKDLKDIK